MTRFMELLKSTLATRFESTFAPVISPTAMMSAVVPVIVTSTTMSIEMIEATSKAGGPKARGVGKVTMPPSPTPEKSTIPIAWAITVPRTKGSRMDRREIIPTPTLDSSAPQRQPLVLRAGRACWARLAPTADRAVRGRAARCGR